jgi:4-oxalocrotonate tautomerase
MELGLMVRRRSCAVSNHEDNRSILRDAHKSALLRMRIVLVAKSDVAVSKKGVTTMPEITISMAAGRTDDQKAGMMRDITQALVKNLGVEADAVVIQINEAPLAHKMKGGKTFVERRAAQSK